MKQPPGSTTSRLAISESMSESEEPKTDKKLKKEKKSKKDKKDNKDKPEKQGKREKKSKMSTVEEAPKGSEEEEAQFKKPKDKKRKREVEPEAEEAQLKKSKDKKRKREAEPEAEASPIRKKKKDKKEKKKSKGTKPTVDENTGPAEAQQWNVLELDGGSDRQNKFLRLLGGKKTGAKSHGASSTPIGSSNAVRAEAAIQRQFEVGMKMKNDGGQNRRGLGA